MISGCVRKMVRKKPWVRYEKDYPLSMVHIGWHQNVRKQQVCAVMDDCSRMILSIGEFPSVSTEFPIELLRQAQKKYEHIRKIPEVITDHGPEFYADRQDKNNEVVHPFEMYCKEHGICHIISSVKHSRTTMKIVRFFVLYDSHRWEFNSLKDFVQWYNCIRPHMSLDFENLETPEQAFYDRLSDFLRGNFKTMTEGGKKGDVPDDP